eukprot:5061885-Prymnesium_polylepis.1
MIHVYVQYKTAFWGAKPPNSPRTAQPWLAARARGANAPRVAPPPAPPRPGGLTQDFSQIRDLISESLSTQIAQRAAAACMVHAAQ